PLFFLPTSAPSYISPLSLHDALPISWPPWRSEGSRRSTRSASALQGICVDARATRRSTDPFNARECAATSMRGRRGSRRASASRSEEHTSELQSRGHLVCRLLLEKKK